MPPKPLLESCVLNVPSGYAFCGFPDGEKFNTAMDADYERMVNAIEHSVAGERMPLTYVDKAIALRPMFYKALIEYVAELEKRARKSCVGSD